MSWLREVRVGYLIASWWCVRDAQQVTPFVCSTDVVQIFLVSGEYTEGDGSDSDDDEGNLYGDGPVRPGMIVHSAKLVATVRRDFFRSWRPPSVRATMY